MFGRKFGYKYSFRVLVATMLIMILGFSPQNLVDAEPNEVILSFQVIDSQSNTGVMGFNFTIESEKYGKQVVSHGQHIGVEDGDILEITTQVHTGWKILYWTDNLSVSGDRISQSFSGDTLIQVVLEQESEEGENTNSQGGSSSEILNTTINQQPNYSPASSRSVRSTRGTATEFWVDFHVASSQELGTEAEPYKTLAGAIAATDTLGMDNVNIKPGVSSETFTSTSVIDTPMTLKAPNGIVSIGVDVSTVTYTLTAIASPSDKGSVYGAGNYIENTSAIVEATPISNWSFSSWTGDLSGSTNPTTITMDSAKSITAVFTENLSAEYSTSIADLTVDFTDSTTPGSGWTIDSRLWDFGDGSFSTDVSPQYSFNANGVYSVSLMVIASKGGEVTSDTFIQAVTVESGLVASIGVEYLSATSVKLTDTSQGDSIDEWLWTFEDSSTSTSQGSHTRSGLTAGDHTITLKATQVDDAFDTETITITVVDGPTAAFTMSPDPASATVPMEVSVTNTSTAGSSPITQWIWDFGDGTTASGAGTHYHTYTDETNSPYTLSLTVRSEDGSDTTTKTVTVGAQLLLSAAVELVVETDSVTGITGGDSVKFGDTITVGYTAENSSTGVSSSASRIDKLYLSLDQRVDGEDLELATKTGNTLGTGATETLAFNSITIPDVAPGTYYLIVNLDDTGLDAEVDDTNNLKTIEIVVVDEELSL